MTENIDLRRTFDEVAAVYNEIRPTYPDELFTELVRSSGITIDSRLLEIGPGTGQATRSLAKFGFDITGIELGASLASIAATELKGYANVKIVAGSFEEVELQPGSFDLIYAATAFHWIDPAVKYVRSHELLKTGGHLAIIHTNHVSDEKGDAFLTIAQPIYEQYDFAPKGRSPIIPRHRDVCPESLDTNLFEQVYFETFPIVITYSAAGLVKLLNTFSNHLAAPTAIREAFFAKIEALINDRFSGEVEKHYSMSLTVARKN
jgi:SAM-dependent methyltransferase